MKPTIAASESGSAEADPLGRPVSSNGSTPPKLPPRSPWRVQSRSVLASVAAMRQPVTNRWRIHPAVQRADAVPLGNPLQDGVAADHEQQPEIESLASLEAVIGRCLQREARSVSACVAVVDALNGHVARTCLDNSNGDRFGVRVDGQLPPVR